MPPGRRPRASERAPPHADRIRDRGRDPFFTTKDVSRGTGQALAIIDRHHVQLSVETVAGAGTMSALPVRASGDRAAVAVRAAAGQ